MIGASIKKEEFYPLIKKINEKLKPIKEFTSDTYQSDIIELKDGNVVLLKPKQEFILEVFKSFNLKWLEIKVDDLKVNEL
jgi:hypothetical protein